jgi:putative ATPase
LALVQETGDLPVPLHLRNAPTKLMKELNYGKEYKYSHDFKDNFTQQDYLPEEIKNRRIWKPQNNPAEGKLMESMRKLWGDSKF